MIFQKPPDKLKAYKDPTGEFSNRKLRMGEWYLKHKLQLANMGKGILVVWCIVTVGFSLFMWGHYLFVGYNQDLQLHRSQLEQVTNFVPLHELYGAKDLQVERISVYQSSASKYDFVADINNINEDWVATLRYYFVFGNSRTETVETIIMPASKRPVAILGRDLGSFPTNARFEIEDVTWKRVDAHEIADVAGFMNERIIFSVENFNFSAPGLNEGPLVPSVQFDFYNDSAYSYWEPTFLVELFSGNQRMGVINLVVDQFLAGEKRNIDLRYFGGTINVSSVVVSPTFDVFDEEEFIGR